MFDTLAPALPASPWPDAAGVLDAGGVAGWKDTLAAALEAGSGLDDAGRVDSIRALEELVCVATAAQAQLSVELDESQRQEQDSAGVPAARQGRGVASQVAFARRESPHRAQRHLGLAKVAAAELPCTWAAWRAGRITEWKATLIARETACLSLADRVEVDRIVAGDPDKLEAMGDRELASAARKEGYRLDPEAHVTRRRNAEADRHTTLRPAPDTMAWFGALLPVADGVATHAALLAEAKAARAAGDQRSQGQLMADTLVARVTGKADEQGEPAAGSEVDVTIDLTMSDQSLFGTSDEPAHVDGYGPIPAELAREIVAGALTRDQRVHVRRLFTRPDTGELVAMDARTRLFRGCLARFIRLRDQTCRTPWCDAPIRHTDHSQSRSADGPTSAENGQGLCEACNYAKQAPGWRARPAPDDPAGGHQVETTTPTGHRYRTRPPTVATIRELPLRIDYVLTG